MRILIIALSVVVALSVILASQCLYSQSNFSESDPASVNLTGGDAKTDDGTPCFYVCGMNGVIRKKVGFSGDWVSISNGLPVTNYHVIFVNNCDDIRLYFTIGGVPYYAYSTNGGQVWTYFSIPQSNYVNAQNKYVSAGDAPGDTTFVYGDPKNGRWSLMVTTNNGQTFDTTGLYVPQQGTEFGWEYCMAIKGKNVWYGANSPPGLYRGYGLRNWQRLTVPGLNWVYCVWFNDTSKGMIGGDNGILYTTNKGDSWTPLPIGGSGDVRGLVSDGGVNWWAARGSNIWYSSNYGVSWNMVYTAPSGTYNHIAVDSTRHVFLGIRNNGGITIGTSTIGIHPISNQIPNEFKLEQNYPNPFNPVTNVKFRIPNASFVKLRVFDITGKEIVVLVSENLHPGTFDVDWNALNFPSGVYFYSMHAGSFTETKKMVLIK